MKIQIINWITETLVLGIRITIVVGIIYIIETTIKH